MAKSFYYNKLGIPVYPVITARAGSTGIKNKNIQLYNGKHLIGIAIEKIIEVFGCCNISSDTIDYFNIAKTYGDVNTNLVKRPIDTYEDVTLHLQDFASNNVKEDNAWILLIQCTSPNLTTESLISFKTIFDHQLFSNDSIICSMYKLDNKITSLFEFNKDSIGAQSMLSLYPSITPSCPRQLIPDCYALSGGFFCVSYKQLMKNKESFFNNGTILPVIIPNSEKLDIDKKEDLQK